MAGGIGSRFWPFSRADKPKQFLDFFGTGKSLLQMTVDRFRPLIPIENVFIVTNVAYKDTILKQVPDLSESQIRVRFYASLHAGIRRHASRTRPRIFVHSACRKPMDLPKTKGSSTRVLRRLERSKAAIAICPITRTSTGVGRRCRRISS